MTTNNEPYACGTTAHFNRRTLLAATGASGLPWLTPVAHALAEEERLAPVGKPAKSIIMLWLNGGPSQLETFDPHAGKKIGGDALIRFTGIQIGLNDTEEDIRLKVRLSVEKSREKAKKQQEAYLKLSDEQKEAISIAANRIVDDQVKGMMDALVKIIKDRKQEDD